MSRAAALLVVCALGTVQAYVHRVGLAPLLPALMEETGLGYAAAGMLVSAYFWTYTAVQIPVGVMTDRTGPRRTMLTALPVLAAAVIAFSVSRGLTEGVLARCVVGIGAAGFWLPALRLIQEWFPPRARGHATGICMAGAGIGGTAALALMPALAASLGWRWSYATTLVPLVVMLPLTLAWVRPGPHAAELDADPISPSPLGDVAALLRRPVVWWLGLMCLCSYGALLGIVTWLPTFLVETQGQDRATAGLVTALLTLGITASWPAAGFLSDRFGPRKRVGLLGQALAAGACLGLASLGPTTRLPITGALVLATGLVMGGMVTPFLLIPDLVPPRLLGAASGVINTFWLLIGLGELARQGASPQRVAALDAFLRAQAAGIEAGQPWDLDLFATGLRTALGG